MYYLAQPYNHAEEAVRERRYRAAIQAAADYTKRGFLIYSPIISYHEMAKSYKLPSEFTFWRELNFAAIDRCCEVWVLPLDGWEESMGVKAEILYAKQHRKPITYLHEAAARIKG